MFDRPKLWQKIMYYVLLALVAILAPWLSTHPGDVSDFHTAIRLSAPNDANSTLRSGRCPRCAR